LGKKLGFSYSSLALGADNLLYLNLEKVWPEGGFYVLDSLDGSIVWSDEKGANSHSSLSPAIDSAGKVYNISFFYGGIAKLSSYNSTSTPDWTLELGSTTLSSPILTSDNKIYLADQKMIEIIDAEEGKVIFSFFSLADDYFYLFFGALGSDRNLYVASNSRLYAFSD